MVAAAVPEMTTDPLAFVKVVQLKEGVGTLPVIVADAPAVAVMPNEALPEAPNDQAAELEPATAEVVGVSVPLTDAPEPVPPATAVPLTPDEAEKLPADGEDATVP